ncbi:uncharacterized protein [Nicotiana sylvestris]|uniref:Uncharacterized protein LOC104242171 isoform X1 n=1 Tax=Nicotiana sylvestris TaxID=4096 RepID=A0A1U7Y8C1_NICSY|nr:PREDICTED: uncharacterized protein LOC104242171 isoform X1 [Nicotiana sylvestris]XP_009795496.1 PREDICTED: uncharacterized protein LOC104242171 isoform X1 [Nicotiana sylvestris]
MRSKMYASKSRMKVAGKGVKLDFTKILRDLPSNPDSEVNEHVQAPDDDDFESPAPTKKSQQESSRITRSQMKNTPTPVKTLRDLPSTPDSEANAHVQAPDNDDFESPAPTKKLQQESSRMTRSQMKNTPTPVNIVRIRSKKCERQEKSKEKLKFDLVDKDDVGPSVKPKKKKIEDVKHKKSKIEDVKHKKSKIEDVKHKMSKIEDNGESGLDCISKEQRIATRRKLKERKAKLKVGDFCKHVI